VRAFISAARRSSSSLRIERIPNTTWRVGLPQLQEEIAFLSCIRKGLDICRVHGILVAGIRWHAGEVRGCRQGLTSTMASIGRPGSAIRPGLVI
jgi:hypothetical protein